MGGCLISVQSVGACYPSVPGDEMKTLYYRFLCKWRGHHWYCDRTATNNMIASKFYHWICLTCPKQEITVLRDWDLSKISNPSDELDLACPTLGEWRQYAYPITKAWRRISRSNPRTA